MHYLGMRTTRFDQMRDNILSVYDSSFSQVPGLNEYAIYGWLTAAWIQLVGLLAICLYRKKFCMNIIVYEWSQATEVLLATTDNVRISQNCLNDLAHFVSMGSQRRCSGICQDQLTKVRQTRYPVRKSIWANKFSTEFLLTTENQSLFKRILTSVNI
jgi:hypothetical protein